MGISRPFDVGEVAGAGGAVRLAGRVDDVRDRQAVEQQVAPGRTLHLVLGQLAADRDDLGDARHGQQAVAQVELGEGAELQPGSTVPSGDETARRA